MTRPLTDLEAQRIRNGELIGMCFELQRYPDEEVTPMFLHLNERWLRDSLTPEHFSDDRLVGNVLTWVLQEPRNRKNHTWTKGKHWYKVGTCALVFNDLSLEHKILLASMPMVSLNVPFKQFGLEVLSPSFNKRTFKADPVVVSFKDWKKV